MCETFFLYNACSSPVLQSEMPAAVMQLEGSFMDHRKLPCSGTQGERRRAMPLNIMTISRHLHSAAVLGIATLAPCFFYSKASVTGSYQLE